MMAFANMIGVGVIVALFSFLFGLLMLASVFVGLRGFGSATPGGLITVCICVPFATLGACSAIALLSRMAPH